MHNTNENIFGKMRGRFRESDARLACRTVVEATLNGLWALSDPDLEALITEHNARNRSGTHRLRMWLEVEK